MAHDPRLNGARPGRRGRQTGAIQGQTLEFTSGQANSQSAVVNQMVFGPPRDGITITLHDSVRKSSFHISRPLLNFKPNGCELTRSCDSDVWCVCAVSEDPHQWIYFVLHGFYRSSISSPPGSENLRESARIS